MDICLCQLHVLSFQFITFPLDGFDVKFELFLESYVAAYVSFEILEETFIDHSLVETAGLSANQRPMVLTHLVLEHVLEILVCRIHYGLFIFFLVGANLRVPQRPRFLRRN